jgi:hypothetical protein
VRACGLRQDHVLAKWVNASSDVDTAWVRVDRDDDDPRRLWNAVLAAMGRCGSVPASSRLRTGPADAGWDLSAAGSPEFLTELGYRHTFVAEVVHIAQPLTRPDQAEQLELRLVGNNAVVPVGADIP